MKCSQVIILSSNLRNHQTDNRILEPFVWQHSHVLHKWPACLLTILQPGVECQCITGNLPSDAIRNDEVTHFVDVYYTKKVLNKTHYNIVSVRRWGKGLRKIIYLIKLTIM